MQIQVKKVCMPNTVETKAFKMEGRAYIMKFSAKKLPRPL